MLFFYSNGNDLEFKLKENNSHGVSVSAIAHDFSTCRLILSLLTDFCELCFANISNMSLASTPI